MVIIVFIIILWISRSWTRSLTLKVAKKPNETRETAYRSSMKQAAAWLALIYLLLLPSLFAFAGQSPEQIGFFFGSVFGLGFLALAILMIGMLISARKWIAGVIPESKESPPLTSGTLLVRAADTFPIEERIQNLKRLVDSGTISEADYEEQKRRILSEV